MAVDYGSVVLPVAVVSRSRSRSRYVVLNYGSAKTLIDFLK